jgi:uncharacterized protein YacL
MKPLTASRAAIGLVFAVVGYLGIQIINLPLPSYLASIISLFFGIFLGWAGIYFLPVLGKWLTEAVKVFSKRIAAEVISQLHLPKIPQVGNRERESNKWVNPILIDTSTLIDGRIADVIESGFIFGTIIVPDFILAELQHIADSADSIKRSRGRRGLDILENIKKSQFVKTTIFDTGQTSLKNIDERLLKLGKNLKAKILTNDFNLNKVATVSGVKILNVNELANAMKTPLIPGEVIDVKVIQQGKEKSQGVGYLPDGTMIVVENGGGLIGKKVSTKVSRVIQTVAGRMIFVQVI